MTIEVIYQYIFGAAALALLCVVASVFTRRIGAPVLLVFLGLGMLAGEDGPGGIKFDDFSLAFLFGNVALAIIIFDGGLGTRKDTFRVSLKPALSLATIGVIATASITGFAAHMILGLPWQEGLLIGAIVGSTDAAAVFGLLRGAGLELKERTGATLEIESGSNDPMAIFLTITLVHLIQLSGSGNQIWTILSELFRQMGLGLAIGFAGGYLLVQMLRRLPLSSSLYPLLALAGGISLFGLTTHWGGSGFLAIFIAGAMIGNTPLPYSNDIHRFHDGIAWLSQIGMFLMLGLLITPSNLVPIIFPAVAIAFVLIFIARPLAVAASLLPFHFPWREQVFIGWCGLRGAVPIILALFPSLAGLEHTQTYFELVFFVVLISLVLQGWTIAPMARWLQIELPPTAKDPEHLHLTIKHEQDKELLIYPVLAGSRAVGLNVRRLPATEGSQVAGVIRQGILIKDTDQQKLLCDDQVMILATSSAKSELGRVFAPAAQSSLLESARFFGEFVLHSEARLSDVAMAYGFEVDPLDAALTVEQYIVHQFHGKPVVGDHVVLGRVKLIVKEIEGDHIVSVGLKLGIPQK
ncbi:MULTISPECIES: potassium/proton antiporter [unclassified Oceanobacter]|uniref:potassium/proton antiporter n=1 Tax=unclassified Oceanobacter TaxID=2620260 RepID=UPI0026E21C83|nr:MULTISPECIES: potassium/proton antiporter [unclassified Oceanobacter]MDO6681144.1 potassium/proton antiporter [Oceanobacter sp. 5_MG-2023]MDP2608538.1 potassium/proton antiporter [Oceanobacter sp. 1_MG-2023]MDP2611700.1 potassium/proton antiporter [Oceanobacter sp. 2_MG-2023]